MEEGMVELERSLSKSAVRLQLNVPIQGSRQVCKPRSAKLVINHLFWAILSSEPNRGASQADQYTCGKLVGLTIIVTVYLDASFCLPRSRHE